MTLQHDVLRKLCGLVALLTIGGASQMRSQTTQPGEDKAQNSLTITLRDEAPYFTPKRSRVAKGTTITWVNKGPALVHTILVNEVKGPVRSGSIRPGEIWSHTFQDDEDAVIKTSCEVHPYMYGLIAVGNPPESLIAATESALKGARTTPNLTPHVLEFPLPVPNSVPGILVIDKEDNVWFTMGGGGFGNISYPPLNKIGRLTLDGDIRIYSTPGEASGPSGVALARDGSVYITELFGNTILRLDSKRKVIDRIPIPTPESWPTGLVFDPAGNLWVNETKGNKLARLSTNNVLTEFPLPTRDSRATGMVIDSKGDLWIAERDGGKIGHLTQDGTFVEYSVPTPNAKPTGMAADRFGRVWFGERQGNKIGVVSDGQIQEYPLPTPNSGPFSLCIDNDGQVWFTEMYGNRIGVLDPFSGRIQEYDLPTPDSWPLGLAMDSQGNLWYSMQLKNKIGVLLKPGAQGRESVSADAGVARGPQQ
jgi:streptogramin lyase/plastocyanin